MFCCERQFRTTREFSYLLVREFWHEFISRILVRIHFEFWCQAEIRYRYARFIHSFYDNQLAKLVILAGRLLVLLTGRLPVLASQVPVGYRFLPVDYRLLPNWLPHAMGSCRIPKRTARESWALAWVLARNKGILPTHLHSLTKITVELVNIMARLMGPLFQQVWLLVASRRWMARHSWAESGLRA